MKNIAAIFQKQMKDTFKNKTVLIQFIMFPILTIIMGKAVNLEGMPENFFCQMFACMYIGMAPLTSMAAIISEEKEKNTLRVLMMADVKPLEYLVGVGSYIWAACMLGVCVIGLCGKYTGGEYAAFVAIMSVGILTSMIIGAAIGTWSKNQMMATSLTVPIMMIFAFAPMLSMFNETIRKIAGIAYSQQISNLIGQIGAIQVETENVVVILFNILLALLLFGYAYKKSGLA